MPAFPLRTLPGLLFGVVLDVVGIELVEFLQEEQVQVLVVVTLFVTASLVLLFLVLLVFLMLFLLLGLIQLKKKNIL